MKDGMLEVGDVIGRYAGAGRPLEKIVISRVTKTQAIVENDRFRFYRKIETVYMADRVRLVGESLYESYYYRYLDPEKEKAFDTKSRVLQKKNLLQNKCKEVIRESVHLSDEAIDERDLDEVIYQLSHFMKKINKEDSNER